MNFTASSLNKHFTDTSVNVEPVKVWDQHKLQIIEWNKNRGIGLHVFNLSHTY